MNITKDEAASLVDFIKSNLIKDIRDDEYIDSIEWVVGMVHVYEKAKAVMMEGDAE